MKSKILLIEDDESFFDCISMLLDKTNIDVVIIDYLLPDLKGTEVCQHLSSTKGIK